MRLNGILEGVFQMRSLDTLSKFKIARMVSERLNGFECSALALLAKSVHEWLLPDGINFVGSLLAEEATRLVGLSLLGRGLMEAIATAIVSRIGLRYMPKIMHFLCLALECVQGVVSENERGAFELGVTRIVFVALIRIHNFGDRSPVLGPATRILKKVNPRVLECAFETDRHRVFVINAATPPMVMKGPTIQLKAFSAGGSTRKSSSNCRWQSLDAADDFVSV